MSSHGSLSYTLTRDDADYELDVHYTVARFWPAKTYGLPEDCYPAEGGEIEDIEAILDGELFPVTDDELVSIEDHIYANHDYSDNED